MADILASAQKLGKKEGQFRDFLLESRRRLRIYQSPDGFETVKKYELKRDFLKSNPDIPKKELKAKVNEALPGLRIAYADEMIKFLEEVLYVMQIIQEDESRISNNIIPGILDASTSYHIGRMREDIVKIEEPLVDYLAYWKKVRSRGRFPLFSKYNSKYPSFYIDDLISKDKKLLEFTWTLISKLSDAHSFTMIRRKH